MHCLKIRPVVINLFERRLPKNLLQPLVVIQMCDSSSISPLNMQQIFSGPLSMS